MLRSMRQVQPGFDGLGGSAARDGESSRYRRLTPTLRRAGQFFRFGFVDNALRHAFQIAANFAQTSEILLCFDVTTFGFDNQRSGSRNQFIGGFLLRFFTGQQQKLPS